MSQKCIYIACHARWGFWYSCPNPAGAFQAPFRLGAEKNPSRTSNNVVCIYCSAGVLIYLLLLLSAILSCNVIGQNVVTSLEINMDIVTYPREKKDIEQLEFNTLFSRMRIFIF